jgi:transcriptional antiterminator RfaH
MSISEVHWCVVHTQSREERRAEHNLRSQGYTLFAPFVRRKVRHARQLKTVEAPLFPRYIFVRLDLDRDRWRNINATAGVCHLITIRDRPLPLPAGLVEALMAAHAPGSLPDRDGELHVNKTVQLRGGPFADLIGRIERVDEGGRVQVLLEIMGRAVLVQTTVGHLSPPAERCPTAPATHHATTVPGQDVTSPPGLR